MDGMRPWEAPVVFASEAEAYEYAKRLPPRGGTGTTWPNPDLWPVRREAIAASVEAMVIARERGWTRDVEAWLTDPLVLIAVESDENTGRIVEDCRHWLQAQVATS